MQKRTKHISFDLWGTLIKSNPQYKETRTEYFFNAFNKLSKTRDQIRAIFDEITQISNTVNETVGYHIGTLELYTMALYKLGYDLTNLTSRDIYAIYHKLEASFIKHHPVLWDDNTEKVLKELRGQGYTLSILSNTNFIMGTTLKKALQNLNIGSHFSFQIYSDSEGLSKPNAAIFDLMTRTAISMNKELDFSSIIHVGDTPKTDVEGAKKAGITSYLINTNDKTIKDVLML